MPQQNTTEEKKKKTRTARPGQNFEQRIPNELVLLADGTQNRVDKNFVSFVRKQDRPDVEVLHELFPIIRDRTHMSKLLNGVVHVNLEILVALHHVYGIDLNEFIAGSKSERPSLTPKQVETLREIVRMYDKDFEKSSQK